MAPSPNPEQASQRLNLSHLPQISATQPRSGSSTANTSPIDSHPGATARSPFGNAPAKTNMSGPAGAATSRTGAGSPSHDMGTTRPYSKRAREIQASEGLTPQFWGPPASGGSTPLRETIPESPSQDGFPDFLPPNDSPVQSTTRRPRAGTVPSRLSPAAPPGLGSTPPSQSKSTRPTPSTSPFRSSSFMGSDSPNSTSALLSRLRAGSMPQQKSQEGTSPFGTGLFSSNWNNNRNRSSTLASVRSADVPNSPAHSSFSKDGLTDTDVKTLDYLGLAETPRQNQASLVQPLLQGNGLPPYFNDIATMNRNLSRLRSFSVNAKEKYADDEDDQYTQNGAYSGQNSGIVTPMDAALAQTRAQIHHHNLAVQAFASQASANRPRARTAGVLDSPLRPAPAPIRLPTTRPRQISNAIPGFDWSEEYEGLPEAVQAMNLNTMARRPTLETLDDSSQEKPTRALWLGNIPTSTTTSSLEALFAVHGKIESSRVLMHKNCGFVNFEHVDSARLAKATFNGKEIFPGAGPVKIGYAKEPNSSSVGGTPGNFQSRSPDPFSRGQTDFSASQAGDDFAGDRAVNGTSLQASAALEVPNLAEAKADILQMAHEFGATAEDRYAIEDSIIAAQSFTSFEDEIPQVPEPSQNRLYDAPRLRDIRKRIDNSSMSQPEIEETAKAMLPEVAELSSDYLGNTVVQKLFEFCSESIKEQMLAQVAPHLAQIGVHKNGTWAAQKIIDVCKVSHQKQTVVDCLRPYTVALFLDQYGNYVLQGCLRFGAPHNNFIFETMLSRMWDIAQGRFGARATRACLESHHATRSQQRMLAAAIVLHSVKLATNANGALLLTWFLDTCTLQHRRTALAPKLVPHLVHLCTHKVAYLTVLKVINQRNEIEAREIVLHALFSEDCKVLEEILSDQQCGATLIFKVLTTPCFDESQRNDVLQKVRNVLVRLKASPSQGYKRLMDEVGLSVKSNKGERDITPNGHASHQERPRSALHGGSRDRRHHQPDNGRQYNDNRFLHSPPQQPYAMQTGFSGTSGMDPSDLIAYEQMSPNYSNNPLNGLSYQQAMLGRDNSPGGFYPNVGIPGYPATSAGINQLPQRPLGVGPNTMMPQNGYSQPGMNPMMGYNNMQGFQQFPMQYPQQQPMMQADMRGRRR